MSWLLRNNWLWALLAFLLGALITWLLLVRRVDTATEAEPVRRPADERDLVPITAAGTASTATITPDPPPAAAKPTDDSDSKVTTVEPVPFAKQSGDGPEDDKAATETTETTPTATTATGPHPRSAQTAKAPDLAKRTQPAASRATDTKSKDSKQTDAADITGAELDEDTPTPDDSAESSAGTERAAPDDSAESSRSADVAAAGQSAEQSAPYGEGSAAALPDGSAPEGYTIKGNADSMLYHTPDSPSYAQTKAEAWFRTEQDAERAGFTRWGRN